ncbi:hypothetical protein EVAR_7918_1 [Eumeta japonica]|uniref:Uncharacterized protein n=1 Tax=Eumeta variegata TaxID=151549 RepID=A0A4C1TV69_EUMVA|nr:hypothetical protein EVAR_7918_1 [Eumeta japonica]
MWKPVVSACTLLENRLLETTRFGTDGLLNLASGVLGDGQDFHGCALKLSCLTARDPNLEHSLGIFQQFSSNTLVSSMLNSTAIEDAVRGGREGRDCETYYKCPIKDSYVKSLLENISRFEQLTRKYRSATRRTAGDATAPALVLWPSMY